MKEYLLEVVLPATLFCWLFIGFLLTFALLLSRACAGMLLQWQSLKDSLWTWLGWPLLLTFLVVDIIQYERAIRAAAQALIENNPRSNYSVSTARMLVRRHMRQERERKRGTDNAV